MRDNLGRQYSILQDREFALSREAIIASRKKIKKEGKGNKPRASEPLESEDFECLWESGALGDSDLETLQNSVRLLVCMHMGMRSRDEHHRQKPVCKGVKQTTRHEKRRWKCYAELSFRTLKLCNSQATAMSAAW